MRIVNSFISPGATSITCHAITRSFPPRALPRHARAPNEFTKLKIALQTIILRVMTTTATSKWKMRPRRGREETRSPITGEHTRSNGVIFESSGFGAVDKISRETGKEMGAVAREPCAENEISSKIHETDGDEKQVTNGNTRTEREKLIRGLLF